MKLLTIALLVGVSVTVAGCGMFERFTATTTGWSRQCIDGVSYLQFASGASVEYARDGKIKTCGR